MPAPCAPLNSVCPVVLVERDQAWWDLPAHREHPDKAMLHAAGLPTPPAMPRRSGWDLEEPSIDLGRVARIPARVVDRLFKGLTGLVRGRGIEVVAGGGASWTPPASRSATG